MKNYPKAFEKYWRCCAAKSWRLGKVKHIAYLAWQAGRGYGKPSLVRKAVPYVEDGYHEKWDFLIFTDAETCAALRAEQTPLFIEED